MSLLVDLKVDDAFNDLMKYPYNQATSNPIEKLVHHVLTALGLPTHLAAKAVKKLTKAVSPLTRFKFYLMHTVDSLAALGHATAIKCRR